MSDTTWKRIPRRVVRSKILHDNSQPQAELDVDRLQHRISKLETQIAIVERERNYHASSSKELMTVVESQRKEATDDTLIEKIIQVTELSMEVDTLKEQINASKKANEKLRVEREMENQLLREVVRSLENEKGGRGSFNASPTADDDNNNNTIISTDDGVDLKSKMSARSVTTKIKIHIAGLEKAREKLARKCRSQEKRITILERTNKGLVEHIEHLEGDLSSEDEAQVQPSELGSLPPPPPMIEEKKDPKEDSDSEGEYEDEDYGISYSQSKDSTRSLEPIRYASIPDFDATGILGKEERPWRNSDPATESIPSFQRREDEAEASTGTPSPKHGDDESTGRTAITRNPSATNRRSGGSQSYGVRSPRMDRRSGGSQSRSPRMDRRSIGSQSYVDRDRGSGGSPFRSLLSMRRSRTSSILSQYDTPKSFRHHLTGSTQTPNLSLTLSPRTVVSGLMTSSNGRESSRIDNTGRVVTNVPNQLLIKIKDKQGIYVGPIKDNMPNGVGTVRFTNGDTYIGQIVNGKLHGSGTYYYGDKKLGILRGIWRKNKRWE